LNLARRHLTAEEIKEMQRRKRAEGKSTRTIARETGTSDKTVRTNMKSTDAEKSAPVDFPAAISGADGKRYPARRLSKEEQQRPIYR
jgi:hypothetical protein